MDPIFQLMEMVNPKEDTFANVGYFISGKIHPKLIEMLDKGGGRQKTYPTVGVTHFIAGDGADKDKMDEAKDIFDIPIVSPRWIIYSTHHGKALPASWFLAEGKELFAGLCFTSSGVRGNDLMNVWSLITYHNGTFVRHLTKNCTHVIANETTGQKCVMANEYSLPVVCVDWIMDSIKAGKRLSEKGYHPRFLRPSSPKSMVLPLATHGPVVPPAQVQQRLQTTSPVRPVPNAMIRHKADGVDYPQWFKDAGEGLKQRKVTAAATLGAPALEVQQQIPNTHLNGTDRLPPQTTDGRDKLPESQGPPPHPSQGAELPVVQTHGLPYTNHGPTLVQQKAPLQSGQGEGSMEDSVSQQGQTNSVIRHQSGDKPNQEQHLPQGHQETPAPKEIPRPTATVEQMEIIQLINHDPQIKLQWSHMDQGQRMLLIQKLAQKSREEKLRKEMMLKQRQMQQNQLPPHGGQDTPGVTPSRLPQSQPQGGMSSYPNQELRRLRFPSAQPGNFQQSGHQGPRQQLKQGVTGEEVNMPYSEVQPQQQQGQQIFFPHNQQQSPSIDQGQSRHTIFFTQGNLVTPPLQQQRQILVSPHQSGAIIRAEQQSQKSSSFSPDELPPRIPTSQQPQTPNQKVQAYLQNSIIPMQQEEQKSHMSVTSQSQQHPAPHFYGHTATTTPQPQQRLSIRPVLVQGQQPPPIQPQQQQQQQALLVDPQSSPVAQQPRDPFQWSPNSQSQSSSAGSFNSAVSSSSQAQRLISPTGTVGPRQQRPTDPQQQQQWTLRTQAPQLIYTTQPNMPYSQLMNQKTKTALANLLSNRLMGSTTPEAPSQVSFSLSCGVTGGMVLSRSPSPLAPPPTPSSMNLPVQNRVSAGLGGKPTTQPPSLQRRLSNLNNNEKGALVNNSGPMVTPPPPPPSAYTGQSSRFYGHDPSIKLPDGGFLLGCVFWCPQELPNSDWRRPILKHGGEIEMSYSNRVTHVLCMTQKFQQFQQCVRERKRLVTLFWLNDVVECRTLSSPSQAVHLPLPFNEDERPYFSEVICTSGFNVKEKVRLYSMCTLLGLRVTPVFTRSHIGLIAKSPEGEKFLKAREWKKPVVNIQFLNELLFGHTGVIPMIHSPKYQQFNMGAPFSFDVGLVVPLMAAWKTPLRVSSEALQKFQTNKRPASSPPHENPASKKLKTELDELFPPPSPRPPSETPPPSIDGLPEVADKAVVPYSGVSVMITAYSPVVKLSLTEKVEELGGRVTTDRHLATHLVVDKTRFVTKTMVLFLAFKDRIVGIEWLRDSYAQKKFLPVDSYLLTIATCGIHQINCTSLFKMSNRNRLFTGLSFYITPTARQHVQEIIEAYSGRIVVEHSMEKVYEAAVKNPDTFVVVTCCDDEYLLNSWKRKEGIDKIIVVNDDIIYTWILKQDMYREQAPPSSGSSTSDLLALVNPIQPPSLLDGSGDLKKMSSTGELISFGNA